jgi:hypothetical protein
MFDLQADPYETLEIDEVTDLLPFDVIQDDFDWQQALAA